MTANTANTDKSRAGHAAREQPIYGNRWVLLALIAIIAANVLGSLHWLQRNIVLVGHDATRYLETTFAYADFLTILTPQTLFQAFTYPPYRTPALYIASQPFVRLFGRTMDGAQLLNVALLGVVVWLTFVLARTKTSATTALFAALLVGMFPMMSAMARLYYTEMFLTTMVVLCLLALWRGEDLTHRGWALILGAGLGVGLLVKWTMPIYVAFPLAWVVWEGHVLQQLPGALRQSHIHVRDLLIAIAVAATLSVLWFLPNRAALQAFPLGDWILLVWAALLAVLVYGLRRPVAPLNNLVVALALALVIASLWYGPHADFGTRVLAVDAERSQEAIGIFGTGNHLRYLRYIYGAHLGPLAFWLFMPAALAPWLWALVRRRRLIKETALLWISLVSAFGALSLLSQANERNLVPLVPVCAVLAAVGLWLLPRWLRSTVATVWVVVLLLQWSLFTFDVLADFRADTRTLWARSAYVVAPASHDTDPAYWIAPDILQRLDDGDETPESLAVLVNTDQLHRGVLKYVATIDGHAVEINDATESAARGWFEVLASQWVLLKDGDNRELEGDGALLSRRILAGDPLFTALYREAARYPLPNGETVFLYHRSAGPGHPKADVSLIDEAATVADAVRSGWSDQAVIVYGNSDLAVWVGMHDLPTDRVRILNRDDGQAEKILSEVDGVVMLILDQSTASLPERLGTDFYWARDVGGDRIWVAFLGHPGEPLQDMEARGSWPPVTLKAARSLANVRPGDVIPVEMSFAGNLPPTGKISLRLVDANSQELASQDRALAPNVQMGLFVPPTTHPGIYSVAAVIYDGATLAPIADANGEDQVVLFQVEVEHTTIR